MNRGKDIASYTKWKKKHDQKVSTNLIKMIVGIFILLLLFVVMPLLVGLYGDYGDDFFDGL